MPTTTTTNPATAQAATLRAQLDAPAATSAATAPHATIAWVA